MQYKVPLLQWTCRDETIDEASNNPPGMSPRSEYTRLAWLGGRDLSRAPRMSAISFTLGFCPSCLLCYLLPIGCAHSA